MAFPSSLRIFDKIFVSTLTVASQWYIHPQQILCEISYLRSLWCRVDHYCSKYPVFLSKHLPKTKKEFSYHNCYHIFSTYRYTVVKSLRHMNVIVIKQKGRWNTEGRRRILLIYCYFTCINYKKVWFGEGMSRVPLKEPILHFLIIRWRKTHLNNAGVCITAYTTGLNCENLNPKLSIETELCKETLQ